MKTTSSKETNPDILAQLSPRINVLSHAPLGFHRSTLLISIAATLGALTAPASGKPPHLCHHPVIHIDKGSGILLLTCQGKVSLYGPVSFGGEPRGPKHRSGDQRTPEGRYTICVKKHSARYHKFLGISYPGPRDAAWGLKRHLISRAQYRRILRAHRRHEKPPWTTRLGGAIGIHGATGRSFLVTIWNSVSRIGKLYRSFGFTDGCIIANNDFIDRLHARVKIGTPVIIHPLRDRRRHRSRR